LVKLNTMKQILITLVIAISLVACKKDSKKEAVNPEAAKEETPQISLHTLDGGTIQVNMLEIFSQGNMYKGETKEFADPIYVIKHPEGNLVWDAGLGEGLVGLEPVTTPDGAFTVSRKDSIVNQLKTIDLTPEDINFLALSHTHFDHSGSAGKLKNATWLVQEKEYNFVTSPEQQEQNADNYNAVKDLEDVMKLDGDYDVFNDGTVIIKSMPGHTPGHQVLYLDLPQTGPVLLTGDLYHFQENRDNKGVPSFNFNVQETLKSMEAFEAFAKKTGAKVIIQHELKDYNNTPKVLR